MGTSPQFVSTRWSLVLAAGQPGEPGRSAALSALCEAYWRPVFAFVRRSGKSHEDAEDLTQAFFARMIANNDVQQADPARGRFRTFLLASVRHFLINDYHAARAQKRGGGFEHIAVRFDGDAPAADEPADHETPETVFDRRWALATLDLAMGRLAVRYDRGDRRRLFEHLRPLLAGGEPDYPALAEALGLSEGAVRVGLHRMRRSFKDTLRAVVLDTVARPEDVDDELRYLVVALSR